ncbi:MAG: COG1361 S-layer family protein [Candidatus Woesearchaeota archaeon]
MKVYMKRKMILFVTVLIIILASLSISATESLPRGYALQITLVNQEPDPVEPGENVDVRFKIENIGSSNAEDIVLELMPEHPFYLVSGDDKIKKIGSVHGRQIGDTGVIVKYTLKVSEDAVEGVTDLALKYQIKGNSQVLLDPFELNIRTRDAIISIDSVKVEPEMIAPGSSSLVKIMLNNIADSLLKDIKVKINLGDVPLAPLDSSDQINLKRLNPGQVLPVTFKLAAEPDAESSLYKIPIKIEYQDELGNEYLSNNTIGVFIGEEPDLVVNVQDSAVNRPNTRGIVSIRFTNKGSSNINFVYVKLLKSDDFEILGVSEDYVGKIDSDDYESADFEIFTSSREDIILPLEIEYSDANNNPVKIKKDISLRIFTDQEAKKFGIEQKSSGLGIVIIIIIVVGGVFIYLWFRKRKKKKMQK